MRKLTLGFTLFLFSCSDTSSFSLYEIVNTGSATVVANSSSSVYDSTAITITNGSAVLKTQYTSLDQFSDLTAGNWTTQVTLPGGSFSVGPDFSGGTMGFTSITDWVGLANVSSTLTDYVMIGEFSASVFDGGNTISTCMRLQANLDDQYRLSLAGGTMDISYRAAAAWTSAGTAAVSLTPTAGSNYRFKATASGSTIAFKVWDITATEPTTDQLSVTDATYSSGYPCVIAQAGIAGAFDNLRIGSATMTSDYVKTNPTFVFPAFSYRAGISSISSSVVASGSDAVLFDVSTDGGTVYQIWDGTAWVTNTSGYTTAMTLSTLSAQIGSLAVGGGTVLVRAYMHSETGYTTPSVGPLTVRYR